MIILDASAINFVVPICLNILEITHILVDPMIAFSFF